MILWLLPAALADGPELAADPYRPQAGEQTLLVQDATRGPDLAAGAWMHHVRQPLVYIEDDTNEVTELVHAATALDLAAAWGFGRFRAQIGAPIYLASSGDLQADRGAAVGDLGLDARAWLLGNDRADLAAIGRLGVGWGGSSVQLGEPGIGWELGLAGGVTAGPARVVANAAYKGSPGVELENVDLDDALRWGLGAHVGEDTGASLELVGQAAWRELTNRAARPAELAVTAWTGLGPGRARVGLGTGLSPGIGSPKFRVVAGYEVTWESPSE
ncbi:MAG: hypothetical protein GY884_30605 [Proteobacteria bacterium]|nr:hypothetical protein [Pseudomonadota bacterium]